MNKTTSLSKESKIELMNQMLEALDTCDDLYNGTVYAYMAGRRPLLYIKTVVHVLFDLRQIFFERTREVEKHGLIVKITDAYIRYFDGTEELFEM